MAESELGRTTTDPETKKMIVEFRAIAIPAEAIARAILFALDQPENVDVSERSVRPTAER